MIKRELIEMAKELPATYEEIAEEFRKECNDLGIEGKMIKRELIEMAKELPATYEEIAEEIKEISSACNVYQDFMKDLLDEGCNDGILENLRFLVENGNVTTYEWMYREKPLSVEYPSIAFDDDNETTNVDEIDFGE